MASIRSASIAAMGWSATCSNGGSIKRATLLMELLVIAQCKRLKYPFVKTLHSRLFSNR